jgi:hypothetical protein
MSQFLTHKSVFKLAGCAEQKKQESPLSNVKLSTKALLQLRPLPTRYGTRSLLHLAASASRIGIIILNTHKVIYSCLLMPLKLSTAWRRWCKRFDNRKFPGSFRKWVAPRQLLLRACDTKPAFRVRQCDRQDLDRFQRRADSERRIDDVGGRLVRRQRVCVMRYAPLDDINRQIIQLAERAARLSHHLHSIQTDDVQVRSYAHRAGVHLADAATIIRTTPTPTGVNP